MKRLIKRANFEIPEIGQTTTIQNDPKYKNQSNKSIRGLLRTGPLTIVDGQMYFEYGGEHADKVEEIYEQNEMYSNYKPELGFGYWMTDFLGHESVFFDSEIDYNKYAKLVKDYDPDYIIYLIQDSEDNLLRLA